MFFLLPNPRYPPPVSFQDAEQEEEKEEKGEKEQKKKKIKPSLLPRKHIW